MPRDEELQRLNRVLSPCHLVFFLYRHLSVAKAIAPDAKPHTAAANTMPPARDPQLARVTVARDDVPAGPERRRDSRHFCKAIETPTSIKINSNPMFEPELAKIDGSDDNTCALDTRLTASTAVNHPIVDPTELSPFTTISDYLAALLHDTHSLFPLTNVGLGIQEYPIDHARLAEIHIADLQASKFLIL